MCEECVDEENLAILSNTLGCLQNAGLQLQKETFQPIATYSCAKGGGDAIT